MTLKTDMTRAAAAERRYAVEKLVQVFTNNCIVADWHHGIQLRAEDAFTAFNALLVRHDAPNPLTPAEFFVGMEDQGGYSIVRRQKIDWLSHAYLDVQRLCRWLLDGLPEDQQDRLRTALQVLA